jgi:hypothetical protein
VCLRGRGRGWWSWLVELEVWVDGLVLEGFKTIYSVQYFWTWTWTWPFDFCSYGVQNESHATSAVRGSCRSASSGV